MEVGRLAWAADTVSEASAFSALTPVVRDWFRGCFGRPTAAQRLAWPAIAAENHLLLSAPTGLGKTLAAFAPILGSLVQLPPVRSVRCLYLSPLKALANDVRLSLRSHLHGIAQQTEEIGTLPRVALRTGDTPAAARRQLWTDPPDILLTTPESLALLLTHPTATQLFSGLRWVIVDELHALAGNKRGADLSLSLERLQELTPRGYQRLGLSASASPLEVCAQFLVGAERPCTIACVPDTAPLELTLRPLQADVGLIRKVVDEIVPALDEQRSILIFTNTRSLAERLGWVLRRRIPALDQQIAVHHSSLAAVRRRRIERLFKQGRLRVVVSSTSLELGVDIGTVDLVILVHPPGDVIRLLQRVGRAGHGPGKVRRGLVFTANRAELLEAAVTGAAGRDGQCEPLEVPRHPLDVLCQQLLGMAATRPWSRDEAFRLVRQAFPYRELSPTDFADCLSYLSGQTDEGVDWLPARLHWEGDEFMLRSERVARVLRRNLGTILAEEPCLVTQELPAEEATNYTDEESASEPLGPRTRLIGQVDQAFAERLQPGDRFLLDGRCLEFRRLDRSRPTLEMVVLEVVGRPRIPVWGGEGWPLSPELARRVFVFRGRAAETLREGPAALAELFRNEYDLTGDAIDELVSYVLQQETLSEVPDESMSLVEAVPTRDEVTYFVHTPLNRRANDALARVASLRLIRARGKRGPVVSVVADLGFALSVSGEPLTPDDLRQLLARDHFDEDLGQALASSPVLRERFRRVALVGLMLLRNPIGRRRRVGGPSWGESRLFDQVQQSYPDFVLLRQAQREVDEDICDRLSASTYLKRLTQLPIRCRWLAQPSPFAESWTQPLTTLTTPLETPEESLRRLQATLLGENYPR